MKQLEEKKIKNVQLCNNEPVNFATHPPLQGIDKVRYIDVIEFSDAEQILKQALEEVDKKIDEMIGKNNMIIDYSEIILRKEKYREVNKQLAELKSQLKGE